EAAAELEEEATAAAIVVGIAAEVRAGRESEVHLGDDQERVVTLVIDGERNAAVDQHAEGAVDRRRHAGGLDATADEADAEADVEADQIAEPVADADRGRGHAAHAAGRVEIAERD